MSKYELKDRIRACRTELLSLLVLAAQENEKCEACAHAFGAWDGKGDFPKASEEYCGEPPDLVRQLAVEPIIGALAALRGAW